MDPTLVARLLGRRGGLARARRLTTEAKVRIAAEGGRARRRSLQAARRIVSNLRYAGAVRRLRGMSRVTRRTSGPLPGLYPPRP